METELKRSVLKDIKLGAEVYTAKDIKDNFAALSVVVLSSPEVEQTDIVKALNGIISAFTSFGGAES